MLITQEMTELEDDAWDDPVDVLHYLLVSHPRKDVPEDALTSPVRTRAEMKTSHLTESVGGGAADAVVVALDVSTPQGRRRKKVVSVGINDQGTTPTHARLNFACRREHSVPESEHRNAMRTELPWVNVQNGNEEQSSTSMALRCTLMPRFSSLTRERILKRVPAVSMHIS
jgi:hypothetical protein